ncbi:hypothetical protein BC832DRAFT_542944 [Gaertneriomyces semiglobifer]|nr:hypothetical protein BC832DRAFT_542944 [Gaertneriomyces semiglobifer]
MPGAERPIPAGIRTPDPQWNARPLQRKIALSRHRGLMSRVHHLNQCKFHPRLDNAQVPSSTLPGYSHTATPPPSYIAPMTSVASSRSSGTVTTTQSMFNERTPIAPATNERKRRASTELERTRTRPYTSTPISLTQPVQSASVETSGGTPVVPAMVGNGVITTPIVAEREVRCSTRSTRPPERYSPSVPTVTVAAPITHSPAPTTSVPLRRSNRANKGSSVAPPASPVQPRRSTRAKKAPDRYSPGDSKGYEDGKEKESEQSWLDGYRNKKWSMEKSYCSSYQKSTKG